MELTRRKAEISDHRKVRTDMEFCPEGERKREKEKDGKQRKTSTAGYI